MLVTLLRGVLAKPYYRQRLRAYARAFLQACASVGWEQRCRATTRASAEGKIARARQGIAAAGRHRDRAYRADARERRDVGGEEYTSIACGRL